MPVSAVEKIFFAEHLSLMIKGGVTINEALTSLRDSSKSPAFRKVIDKILEGVLRGESLSSNFERHPKVFNKFFCKVVMAGEESGTLEENLMYLADQARSFYQMRKKVRGALVYPVIVIIMAIAIAFGVSFFILPKIIEAFNFLAVQPPLATRILITSSSFIKTYWWQILVAMGFLFFLVRTIKKLKVVGMLFDRIVLSLPFVSSVLRNLNLARAAKTFYTLIKSGVPILEVIGTVAQTLPSHVYKKIILSIRSEIEAGKTISQSLKKFPKFIPPTFVEMVGVGEKAGSFEESFSYLANFYEGEVDSTLKNLSSIIEPALLILVGIFVAFIAIAIIVPIYHFLGEFRPSPMTP